MIRLRLQLVSCMQLGLHWRMKQQFVITDTITSALGLISLCKALGRKNDILLLCICYMCGFAQEILSFVTERSSFSIQQLHVD